MEYWGARLDDTRETRVISVQVRTRLICDGLDAILCGLLIRYF